MLDEKGRLTAAHANGGNGGSGNEANIAIFHCQCNNGAGYISGIRKKLNILIGWKRPKKA